jgi:hypothetical protein
MATTPRSQMALAQDQNFLKRLVSLVVMEAQAIVAESEATQHHAARRNFAQVVLNNPYPTVQNMALTIVNATNLTSEDTTFNFEAGCVETSATDAEIRSQIASLWNAFSGV